MPGRMPPRLVGALLLRSLTNGRKRRSSNNSPLVVAIAFSDHDEGAAVARALLEGYGQPGRPFQVKAFTEHPDSVAARALAALGAEVVEVDHRHPTRVLSRAFQGCNAAFLSSPSVDSHAKEMKEQVTRLADAAVAAGVQHIVWSTHEDTRAVLGSSTPDVAGSRFKVPHLDAKDEVSKLMWSKGQPVTHLLTGFLMEDISGLFQPAGPSTSSQEGPLTLTTPPLHGARLPLVALEDVGRAVALILAGGKDKWAGRTVSVKGDALSIEDCAAVLSSSSGRAVRVEELSSDERFIEWLKSTGASEEDALSRANMFRYYRHPSDAANKHRPLKETVGDARSLRQWAMHWSHQASSASS